jgi:signal transduction histidine kinase
MTMGEMTASIAHEVNQPLAAVMTNGHACLRWLNRTPPDLTEARNAIEQIILAGKRGSEVIGRIRALAKKSTPRKTLLDVNDVIQDVTALGHTEARKHGVLLRTELAAQLPPVEGDRVQLQQVILNLLMNGIEATEGVRGRPRELVIRSQMKDPDTVLVAVEDTGVGFGEDQMPVLFDAFFTTKPGGMGMGLSISRTIIEAHGGNLSAMRNAGPGATFQFVLPVTRPVSRE